MKLVGIAWSRCAVERNEDQGKPSNILIETDDSDKDSDDDESNGDDDEWGLTRSYIDLKCLCSSSQEHFQWV